MKNNNYTIAVVTLQEDCYKKEYGFKCFDETIKNGDSVICDARDKYCVATVLKIQTQEEYGKPVTKDIVCKFDDSEYKQRVKERVKQNGLIMQAKANKYDEMLKCVSFSICTSGDEVKDLAGNVMLAPRQIETSCVIVKIKEMIKAAGFEFEGNVGWSIVE